MVFSTQLCELLPLTFLSGLTLSPFPSPCVNKYTEPAFFNFEGAQESIPPAYVA